MKPKKPLKNAPPAHLTAAAKRLWDQLQADFVLDDAAGRLLLQSALEAWDRQQQARQTIADEGAVVRDRWNQLKANPAVGIERDARTQLHSALRLLKLEPGALA